MSPPGRPKGEFHSAQRAGTPVAIHRSVHIGARQLPGELVLVTGATGLVLFAHGSGSSRHSPRNRHVAEVLQRRHLATLLLDLLHPDEAENRLTVFDIPLLVHRLGEAIDWARQDPLLSALPIGLFGASTGAAAALRAAAAHPAEVRAVVSRGGRPDLATEDLPLVQAPTLLILSNRFDRYADKAPTLPGLKEENETQA